MPLQLIRDRLAQIAAGAWLGMLAFMVMPECAEACSVCLREASNRTEFIVTTGLMTFLPLLAIGSVVWWLRRRVQAMEAAEAKMTASPSDREGTLA